MVLFKQNDSSKLLQDDHSTHREEKNGKSGFRSKAARWDDDPRRVKFARDVADAITAAARPDHSMDAMDFGCGTGLLTPNLQSCVHSITGVDSSAGMLDVLASKVDALDVPNVRSPLCDIDSGGRLGGSYHLIVSSMTLHHVPDLLPLFRIFHEHLFPGGTLCVADLDLEDGSFHDDPIGIFHAGFDRSDLRHLLQEAGFGQIRDMNASVIRKSSGQRTADYPVFLIAGVRL